MVQAALPGSLTALAWNTDADALWPASSRTVTVIVLPGLLCGALVIGKMKGAPAGPLAMTSPSSSRSASTASGLAV